MLVDTSVGKEKVLVKTKPDFTAKMGQECFLNFEKNAGVSSPVKLD